MKLAEPAPAPSSSHKVHARIGLLAVFAVFGMLGAFATLAPLDSAAVAPGTVAAESSTKPVQHLEGGIVREILVKEAEAVKAGQVLFKLEPTQARANADLLKKQIDAALAQEARLAAEREGATRITFPEALLARRSVPEAAAAIDDQERHFAERRASLAGQIDIHKAKIDQTTNELSGLDRQSAAIKEQIASLSTDLAKLATLEKKGLYPANKLSAPERARSRLDGQLAGIEGEMARLGEQIKETRLQIGQTEQKLREEAGQKLTEVRARLAELHEKLKVAEDVESRIEIRAPQNGIVQGLKVFAAGAIVQPGEPLAVLVPVGDKLILLVRVSPLDIDSVAPGQQAEVRLSGFSGRDLKTIMGRVEKVAADAMQDESTQESYFPARVEIDPATVPDEVRAKLQPGMPADVIITTGERTVLQYLWGPLSDLVAKSMREQ